MVTPLGTISRAGSAGKPPMSAPRNTTTAPPQNGRIRAGRHRRRPRLGASFWRLWWANAINSIGDGAVIAAMPLLAVTVTRDPRQISVISAVTYLPWLLLSLPAGAMVDRHDRASLMWRCQAFQAMVIATVAVVAVMHMVSIPFLAVASLLVGAPQVVITNAAQSVLPQIVPAQQLPLANSNQYVVQTVGQSSVGPPLGSLLFTLVAALPFGLDAGSFAVSAALLATLPRVPVGVAARRSLRTEAAEGLRWLGSHPLLRTLALLLAVNTFCNQMGMATLVLLATQTLHLSLRTYGLLLVAIGIGSVLGGLANVHITKRLSPLPIFVMALAANAAVYAGMGLAGNSTELAAMLALSGIVVTLSTTVTVSLRQQIVPAQLLGRVNSVYRMVGWGFMPLGALAGGFAAEQLGLRAPFLIASAVRAACLMAALPILYTEARTFKARV